VAGENRKIKNLKIYLDMCVYNRPFDDQSYPRIMLETQTFVILLEMVYKNRFDFVNSFALEYENSKNPNIENLLKISDFLGHSVEYIAYDETIATRAVQLENRGLMGMDAMHIACAEKAKADFFVTCDDKLIKKLDRINDIKIVCRNLIDFVFREILRDE